MASSGLDPLASLYREAKRKREWTQRMHTALMSEMKARGLRESDFRFYDWNKLVIIYYTDCENFPLEKENIWAQLIGNAATKTRLTPETVRAVMEAVDQRLELEAPGFNLESRRIEPAGDQTIFHIQDLIIDLPTKFVERLLKIEPDLSLLLRLLLRYDIMGRTSGFFWSMERSIFNSVTRLDQMTKPLPTLECFASPFNHYLPDYCSCFHEDSHYGSKGNFFDYMATLSGPQRFVFNPPYTYAMVNESSRVLAEYFEANPGCELVAMLPDWPTTEGLIRLAGLRGSVMVTLQSREYVVYDYSLDRMILQQQLPFVIITNIGELSAKYAQAIKSKLKELAKGVAATL